MNIAKIPINPIRWFQRKPKTSDTPKIDALGAPPKEDKDVAIYGKSGITNSQEDDTVPKIAKTHPLAPEQAPGYFVPGTEAKHEVPPSAVNSGATMDASKPATPWHPATAPETNQQPIKVPPAPAVPAPDPPKVWVIDGTETTDEAAATAQADADQKLRDAKAAASTPIEAVTDSVPVATVIEPKPVVVVAAPIKETTVATTSATAPKESILQRIGGFFKTVFTDAVKVGQAAEPIVDLAFPGIAELYNSAINAAAMAETAAAAAGAQSGTGPQKLSYALSAIEPIAMAWLQQNNITMSTTQFQAWLSAVVDTLNLIPAPSTLTT